MSGFDDLVGSPADPKPTPKEKKRHNLNRPKEKVAKATGRCTMDTPKGTKCKFCLKVH